MILSLLALGYIYIFVSHVLAFRDLSSTQVCVYRTVVNFWSMIAILGFDCHCFFTWIYFLKICRNISDWHMDHFLQNDWFLSKCWIFVNCILSSLGTFCYKVIQCFEVTCFIAGQIITKGESTITDVIYSAHFII